MITLDIRRWNVAHLVGASVGYWLGLAAATLTVLKDGATIYAATAPVLDVALWIAVPPLALWMLWLAFRPSRDSASAMHASPPSGALPDPARGGLTERIATLRSPIPAERPRQRS